MATGSVWTNSGRNEIHQTITGQDTKTISRFIVGTGTTTPLITDTSLTARVAGFTRKAFDVGYPIFDTGNVQATIKGTLSTTEANGNDIGEVALTDTSESLIWTHDVYTSLTKNTSTEVIFEWIYQIRNG